MPIYPRVRNGKRERNVYRVRVSANGKNHEKTFRGTKKEAVAFEARWQLELEAKGHADSRVAPTFLNFCVGSYKIHAENHLKAGTWAIRQHQIKRLVQHFGLLQLTKIGPREVEKYHRARLSDGVRPVTINDEVKVLRAILSYARSIDVPAANPKLKRLPERATRGRVMVWSESEVETLYMAMAAKAPELLPITVALINTGMRKGEALALEWTSIDFRRELIEIYPSEYWSPKNGKPREVPIGSALMPWLERDKEKRKSKRWVFPSSTGERYAAWPTKKWDRARDAAGVGGSPHICRHTFASHFLANVPDLFLLAAVLGHSHSRVTELYSHLLPDHLERARNAVVLPTPLNLVLRPTKMPPQARRKLTDQQVIALRKDREAGMTFADLGQKYGLSKATARSVAVGDTYAEVG